MSLENAINDNTQAILALHGVLQNLGALPAAAGSAATTPPSGAAVADAAAPKTRSPRKGNQTEGEKAAQALIGTDGDPALYDYESNVKPKLMELNATCGREELVALLARFGVAKVGDMKQSMYPEAMKMAQKSIDAANAGSNESVMDADFDPLN